MDLADRFATVDGVRLHYVEAGGGPLVWLLHGFPEVWWSWRSQLPRRAAPGFRVVGGAGGRGGGGGGRGGGAGVGGREAGGVHRRGHQPLRGRADGSRRAEGPDRLLPRRAAPVAPPRAVALPADPGQDARHLGS